MTIQDAADRPTAPDAMVIIDLQNDFCHDDGAMARFGARLSGMKELANANERLAAGFRDTGRPVIFVRTVHGPWTDSRAWLGRMTSLAEDGRPRPPICVDGTWGADFFQLRPDDADLIVTKHRYNAFYGTPLEVVLKSRGIQSVAFTGAATNVCVESTIREGFIRDIDCVAVRDCCAANTPEEHEIGLQTIERYFGRVATSDELLTAMSSSAA